MTERGSGRFQDYREAVMPWTVAQLGATDSNKRIVGRYKNRVDAEGHVNCLNALPFAGGRYVVFFNPGEGKE